MKNSLLIIFLIIFSFSACKKKNAIDIIQIDLPEQGKNIVNGINKAGINIFKTIEDSIPEENILFSPLSLNIPLTILYLGAETETKSELQNFLSLKNIASSNILETYKVLLKELTTVDKQTEFKIASALWANINTSIKSNFKSQISDNFYAIVENIDFSSNQSIETINQWIKDSTDNQFSNIVSTLNPTDAMILLNALYFRSLWHFKFDPKNTVDSVFYLSDSSQISVPTMVSDQKLYKLAAMNNCIIVEMPYSKGNFAMDLIKPDYGYNFQDCINALSDWQNMVNNLQDAELTVILPKFEYTTDYDLHSILKSDLPITFASPNFSNISDDNILINKLQQKNYIKTDEEGTTASSFTFVPMPTAPEPTFVKFDVPFIFIIREVSTGTILFIGKVSNP